MALMKKATTLDELPNTFRDYPLDGEDLKHFYKDTIITRTGDPGLSPMNFLFRSCTNPEDQKAHLLMGHRGCGKSTELNRLAERLQKADYPVKTIYCSQDIDRSNMVYSDIIVLMAEALVSIAETLGCEISAHDRKKLQQFRQEIENEDVVTRDADAEVEAGAGLESPTFLSGFLKFFFSMKTSLKYNQVNRTTIRTKVQNRISEWILTINSIANQITEKAGFKQPILIFEDLDKGNTWELFHLHCEQLTAATFPTIFTFPIELSYSPEFAEIASYFDVRRLPMIKVRSVSGEKSDGAAVIQSIVESRADAALFEEGVVSQLIDMTGGSLRDLFRAIRESAFIAMELEQSVISMQNANIALREMKSDLKIRIQKSDYPFLKGILSDHTQITDQPELLRMMQAGVVLVYNGNLWYQLHPLIAEYLKDIGEIKP